MQEPERPHPAAPATTAPAATTTATTTATIADSRTSTSVKTPLRYLVGAFGILLTLALLLIAVSVWMLAHPR